MLWFKVLWIKTKEQNITIFLKHIQQEGLIYTMVKARSQDVNEIKTNTISNCGNQESELVNL